MKRHLLILLSIFAFDLVSGSIRCGIECGTVNNVPPLRGKSITASGTILNWERFLSAGNGYFPGVACNLTDTGRIK